MRKLVLTLVAASAFLATSCSEDATETEEVTEPTNQEIARALLSRERVHTPTLPCGYVVLNDPFGPEPVHRVAYGYNGSRLELLDTVDADDVTLFRVAREFDEAGLLTRTIHIQANLDFIDKFVTYGYDESNRLALIEERVGYSDELLASSSFTWESDHVWVREGDVDGDGAVDFTDRHTYDDVAWTLTTERRVPDEPDAVAQITTVVFGQALTNLAAFHYGEVFESMEQRELEIDRGGDGSVDFSTEFQYDGNRLAQYVVNGEIVQTVVFDYCE